MSASLDEPRMRAYYSLTPEQQVAAIEHLAAMGWSVYGIAAACRLSVEQVNAILADARRANSGDRS